MGVISISIILLQKAKGNRTDHNSMYEKRLSSPVYVQKSHRNMEVPDYLDHGIDITDNPLYKYLNNCRINMGTDSSNL